MDGRGPSGTGLAQKPIPHRRHNCLKRQARYSKMSIAHKYMLMSLKTELLFRSHGLSVKFQRCEDPVLRDSDEERVGRSLDRQGHLHPHLLFV